MHDPAHPSQTSGLIIRSISKDDRPFYLEFSTNEKVATELAYGAAVNGHLSTVFFKCVGLNVAEDTFVQLSLMNIIGGMVVVLGDDPGANSSQNGQDIRHYAQMSYTPVLEPADPVEAYRFYLEAARRSGAPRAASDVSGMRPPQRLLGHQTGPCLPGHHRGRHRLPHPGLFATNGGHPVNSVDTHGLAQCGGIVVSQIRGGENVYSPLIPAGRVDLVISLERHQALGAAGTVLKANGELIYQNTVWQPLSTRLNDAAKIAERDIQVLCRARDIRFITVFHNNLSDIRMQIIAVLSEVHRHGLIPGVDLKHYRSAMVDLMSGSTLEKYQKLFDERLNA